MYRLYMHCTVTQHLCIELWQKKKVAAQIIQEIKHTEKKKHYNGEEKQWACYDFWHEQSWKTPERFFKVIDDFDNEVMR